MSTEAAIRRKLTQELCPKVLEIFNDSHMHRHHEPMIGNTNPETHFRLVIVSDKFNNKSKPVRHKMVYKILDEELKVENGIHALQMTTKSEEEYNNA